MAAEQAFDSFFNSAIQGVADHPHIGIATGVATILLCCAGRYVWRRCSGRERTTPLASQADVAVDIGSAPVAEMRVEAAESAAPLPVRYTAPRPAPIQGFASGIMAELGRTLAARNAAMHDESSDEESD